jgi:hypothetical protein
MTKMTGFTHHYDNWRQTRISKLHQILGADFFNGKSVLELACGHGDTGRQLAKEGAIVTFAEGRQEHLDVLKGHEPNAETFCIDQDKPWDLGRQFDFVIHWGVLYHLHNWKDDLRCALNHTNLMTLETEVADSNDPDFEIKTNEKGFDQALNLVGSRPSPAMVERHLADLGVKFIRYDDRDLNSGFHNYDWPVRETRTWKAGRRRFWIISK